MVEEVKGLGTGGSGGMPYSPPRRRPQEPAREEEASPVGRRGEDSTHLSEFPLSTSPEGLQALLARLENLQQALLSAAGEDDLRACRAQLAAAEVALSNLLGASGEPSADSLRQTLGSPPQLSAARVLKLLGEGEVP